MVQPHIAQLHSLGWVWRENGVEICVNLDGRELRVFVPLGRVVVMFHRELAREGLQPPPSVGGWSVGGLFDDIGGAFKKTFKGATRAVSRAASTVARTASKYGAAALKPITNNPVFQAIQTGVSFVPGFGTAVSAGMGAAAAIGRGESLRYIGLAAAKNALPGGPVSAAAFDVAVGLAKGQRLDRVALAAARNQIPGGPLAKAAFDAGVTAVQRGPAAAMQSLPGAAMRALPGAVSPLTGRVLPPNLGRFSSMFGRALPMASRAMASRPMPNLGRFSSMFGGRAPAAALPSRPNSAALKRFGLFNAARMARGFL